MESSDCAAAIDPSIFHNGGATELDRFLAGTKARDELGLIIVRIGDANDDTMRSPLAAADASILLPESEGSISGVRLPARSRLSLAADLGRADKDLGLRLLNRPDGAPWWSLSVSGVTLESSFGPPEHRQASGRLEPILVDALGAPVVAVWLPDSDDQRWYVIPDATDVDTILGWLGSQALPELVPSALRRARSAQSVISTLQTPAEESARRALAELEAMYEQERQRLESDLREATIAAEPIRHGLLYGTGTELVTTVASVFSAAGLSVVDVDELLGDTPSADLLVSYGTERRLVEVKSAGGNASERLVADLVRHLATWPQIRPHEPVSGGALIVNHQHRLDPDERAPDVYTRPEFVAALTVPIVSSRQLFDWWRVSNWNAIREAVLAVPSRPSPQISATPAQGAPEIARGPREPAARTLRRWWQHRNRRQLE